MVNFLNVKIRSIPIERGLYLIGAGAVSNFILITLLIFVGVSWRLKSIEELLIGLNEVDQEIYLKKFKKILRIWSKIEDLICSINKYFLINNLFFFASFFNLILIVTFLGYDILVHELDTDDKIFFCCGLVYSISITSCICILIKYSENVKSMIEKNFNQINLIRFNSKHKNVQKYCELAILQLDSSTKLISCGLFEINWQHIFLMLSSLFSYLVVVIQFDYMLTV